METRDVIVIGAGIIGLSIAWQLVRRSNLRVTVLEKGSSTGEGSTGASSAVCRYRYSTDEMVHFARDGIHAYREWQAFTGLTEPRAHFNNDGVLWMPGSDTAWADREHERMQRLGIATEVLDDEQLSERFPAFSSCTVAPDTETGAEHECRGGSRNLFEVDGGHIDPASAMQDLVDACRASKVDIRFRSEVTEIDLDGGRVRAVCLADGSKIATGLLINASGPWCMRLYEACGLDIGWKVEPVRIQVVYRDRPKELVGHIPVTADMEGGIYFRTENRGAQLVVGSVREQDEQEIVSDPDRFQAETDQDFEIRVLHVLHHRFPALPNTGRIRGYCGLYTFNRDDVHRLLGPTAIDGLWAANGFSGHGFKIAPAVGSMVAQAITGERRDFDTEVPMESYSVGREPIQIDNKSVIA